MIRISQLAKIQLDIGDLYQKNSLVWFRRKIFIASHVICSCRCQSVGCPFLCGGVSGSFHSWTRHSPWNYLCSHCRFTLLTESLASGGTDFFSLSVAFSFNVGSWSLFRSVQVLNLCRLRSCAFFSRESKLKYLFLLGRSFLFSIYFAGSGDFQKLQSLSVNLFVRSRLLWLILHASSP